MNESLQKLLYIVVIITPAVFAGVTNPDISVIGQVIGKYSDDTSLANAKKPALELGEVEMAIDAALNPYLTGAFVFSLSQNAFEIEEAYAKVIRGLPLNLALKAGKYRLGFGRLNSAHPHAYPFISTPRVMDPAVAGLLPGTESFNDVAVQASTLIPVAGDYAVLLSGDVLQGDSFHPDTTAADFGWLLRAANSFTIADAAPTEIGVSLTHGTNNPAHNTATLVGGIDVKTKIVLSPIVNVTVQAEGIYKNADHADSAGSKSTERRSGFYSFANFNFQNHYNAGVLYEQYKSPATIDKTVFGIKPFVGFSLLEESTILRMAYEYFKQNGEKNINTVELQFLFSMGPHKAHQF